MEAGGEAGGQGGEGGETWMARADSHGLEGGEVSRHPSLVQRVRLLPVQTREAGQTSRAGAEEPRRVEGRERPGGSWRCWWWSRVGQVGPVGLEPTRCEVV